MTILKITINQTYQTAFIEQAKKAFSSIIIIADDSFQYIAPDIPSLDGFKHFEIAPFGNAKRYELIKKWVELGSSEQIHENAIYENIDNLKQHIDTFVRNNIVPSKPIYLIVILQTFESYSPLGVELTSYGHCYQYLIYKALDKANIRQSEIESYINFLTELAGYFFTSRAKTLSGDLLNEFYRQYKTRYISLPQERIVGKLLTSNILISQDGQIGFKYRYIYYFYAAKFLSETISKSLESKKTIQELIANLHKEECANIIIFITHHTKDSWVIDEIQLSMMELFSDHKEATLSANDLEFMGEFINEIPKLILEQRNIEKEREKDNLAKDKAEAIEAEVEKSANALDANTLLAQINRTFKAIEIVGQILRNRHGSLDRGTLENLVEQSFSVGLRFLSYFLVLSNSLKEEIQDNIQHMLIENPNIANERLEKEVKNLFLMLTFGVIFAVLRKIAFAVGTREIEEIYSSLNVRIDSPAVNLITQSIELQFMKKLDIGKIEKQYLSFRNNPACARVLKEIVVQYIYMHHVGYREKQKLSEAIKLPIFNQLALERDKRLQA